MDMMSGTVSLRPKRFMIILIHLPSPSQGVDFRSPGTAQESSDSSQFRQTYRKRDRALWLRLKGTGII